MQRDDILETAQRLRAEDFLAGWAVDDSGGDGAFWSSYTPRDLPTRSEAGTKIHVSASLNSAGDVLRRAVPILAERGIPFKHASSRRNLVLLSNGKAGLSQIGKFITAYPPDTATAHSVARVLHEATAELEGPRIASEQPLVNGSLVHFRYGSFAEHWLQLATGRVVPARLTAGRLEPDARAMSDGGRTAALEGGATTDNDQQGILRGRYVRMQKLHGSPKGSTWLGYDREGPEGSLAIIKEAYAFIMEAMDGLDARARLSNEAEQLLALQPSGLTPVLCDRWDSGGSAFVVYHLVEGPTFSSVLNRLAANGLRPPDRLLLEWLSALAEAVGVVHRLGFVLGDIKPSNLIFADGRFRFIDLELAGRPTMEPVGSMGTRGYCPPEQMDPAQGRHYSQDIFAIGATILTAATMVDASRLPDALAVTQLERKRQPQSLLYAVLDRCLRADPAERFQTTDEVIAACRAMPPGPREVARSATNFRMLAIEIGEQLLAEAVWEGECSFWRTSHPAIGGQAVRDLYAGSSGTALFLVELFEVTGDARLLDTALACGRWLWERPPAIARECEMPGLYFGESGPGYLYLRLWLASGDAAWLERARVMGDRVAAMPQHSPDLMTGSAGTGVFQLALWRAGEAGALERAAGLARHLWDAREPGEAVWAIPDGHETLSGKTYLGLAHGAAGVGLFLAEYGIASGEQWAAAATTAIAEGLIGLGEPSLADGTGLTWSPTATPDQNHGAYWCHGAAGIARFLVAAHALTGRSEFLAAAGRAGRTMLVGAPWIGTTQCHGLAGNIDVLIDIWSATGGPELEAARRLGENLAAYRKPGGWPGDSSELITPDLIVGQAGIGAAFRRLAEPSRPHIVSVAAIQSRVEQVSKSNKE